MKVLRVALGKSEAEEYQQNLHLLGEHLTGNAGVFFTNLPKEKVRSARVAGGPSHD
jgi:mRNA turnover protein 4